MQFLKIGPAKSLDFNCSDLQRMSILWGYKSPSNTLFPFCRRCARKKAMAKEAWFHPNHDIWYLRLLSRHPWVRARKLHQEGGGRGGTENKYEKKIVETAGPSLASLLTRLKLGAVGIFPDCDFEGNGVDHLRRGANYTGNCNVELEFPKAVKSSIWPENNVTIKGTDLFNCAWISNT